MSSVAVMPSRVGATKEDTLESESPIRVGFVMHSMQVAGAEVLVTQIIQKLSTQISPTIICLDELGELGAKLRDQGVPVVVLGRKPGLDWRLPKRLAAEISERNIEVLHAHQYTPFFYSALAKLRGASSVRILLTEHGRHYPDVVSAKRRLTNRWILSGLAGASTACCGFSALALEEKDGFREVEVLPNGVDLSHLPARGDSTEQAKLRQALGLEVGRPYVACVARFHPIKDHAMLVRAWSLVHQQVPEARLLLVGDGPERERIEAFVEELKISQSVQFLGVRHDVAALLRAADVFALTSISEAASLTLLEAMASECPPVVTDVGGNREHLTDGLEGLLVPQGDSQALSKSLIRILQDPLMAARLGKAARKRVVECFDLNKAVARYHQLYNQLAQH